MTDAAATRIQGAAAMPWFVYIIQCSDHSLYTGITTDVQRRFQQHATQQGAKYFRRCQPLQIVLIESHPCRATASRREAAIKCLSRQQKWALIDASQASTVHPA
jgi:putative endonuclease